MAAELDVFEVLEFDETKALSKKKDHSWEVVEVDSAFA